MNWLKLGRYGVQIFYIISAFTIMMSIEKLQIRGGGYRTFYLRRFFRIAPLWWIALGLTYVYNLMVRNEIGSIGSLIAHIFAIHGLVPQYIGDIIVQGWSVSIEVLFYLFVPVVIKLCNDKLENYIKLIFFTTTIVWIFNIVGDKLLTIYLPATEGTFFYLWMPNQFVAFLVGICLYLVIIKEKKIENWKNTAIYLIGIACVLFFSLSSVLHVSLIEAVVIMALSKYGSKIINNKVFRYVGKVSYGVYLFHMLVICILQDLGFMSHGWAISLVLYFVVVPMVSVGIGAISHYFIEKPFLKLERKIEKRQDEKYEKNFSNIYR